MACNLSFSASGRGPIPRHSKLFPHSLLIHGTRSAGAPESKSKSARQIPPLELVCELIDKPQPGVATPSPTP